MFGFHYSTEREKRLLKREQSWEKEKEILAREQVLREEKRTLKPKRLATAKLLVFFLFLNCSIIELFTGYVTVKSIELAFMMGTEMNFAPLIALIGAVVGEVIGYAIYSLKSMKENTKGGIVYDAAMAEYEPKG